MFVRCASNGDERGSSSVSRAFGARRSRPNTTLKKLDGAYIRSQEDEAERWEEHHTIVFHGLAATSEEIRAVELPNIEEVDELDVGLAALSFDEIRELKPAFEKSALLPSRLVSEPEVPPTDPVGNPPRPLGRKACRSFIKY